ncbi:MAG: methyltransferase domain-containing protein [Chloroflexota bacterium]
MSKDPYRRVAGWYDTLFQSMNAALLSIGLNMFPPKDTMSILDVGCGTGVQLDRYQPYGCALYGIDTSPSMLAVAQERLGKVADLRLESATAMPFNDRMFDLITSTLLLHEMAPKVRDETMAEMQRVLKPNGRLLLIDFHPGPYRFPKGWFTKAFITVSERMAGRDHYRHYRHFMGAKGLPNLIAKHKLQIDQQKIVSGGNMAVLLIQA